MNSSSTGIERRTENVSYKAGIYEAIAELKDRPGSSMIAIKRCMKVKLPNDQQWQNQVFLSMLKVAVAKGDLLQNEVSARKLVRDMHSVIPKERGHSSHGKNELRALSRKLLQPMVVSYFGFLLQLTELVQVLGGIQVESQKEGGESGERRQEGYSPGR